MTGDRVRLGTRGSALALAQARQVAAALEALGAEVELVTIRTSGDERPASLASSGRSAAASREAGSGLAGDRPAEDKARFVKELEQALLDGEIDLAVHSAKDVPSELPDGLEIAAVPERADPRDALCLAPRLAGGDAGAPPARDAPVHALAARPLDPLPEGAVVGTASLRRRSELLALRPDLEVVELRGNVDTRLRRLAEGDTPEGAGGPSGADSPEGVGAARPLDAIVLAAAGLARLGRAAEGTPLPVESLVPAAGQGCLALEARADAAQVRRLAERLTDPIAMSRIVAERTVIAVLEATCNTPVGVHATTESGSMLLRAYVGTPDGARWVREELRGDAAEPQMLGLEVANRVLAAGGAEVLAAAG